MKNLALHILDIAQNSLRAGAKTIRISIIESGEMNTYDMVIEDDGAGIPEALLPKVTDPFITTRTTRKVGLGLPLLMQSTRQTGGSLEILSEEGKGCLVKACFISNHIDRPPLGDIAGVIRILTCANPGVQIRYTHRTDAAAYTFDSRELRDEWSEGELMNLSVQKYLKEMIAENLLQIGVT